LAAALERLPGVKKVDVSQENQSATITLAKEAELSREAVAKALEGTEFKITSFETK